MTNDRYAVRISSLGIWVLGYLAMGRVTEQYLVALDLGSSTNENLFPFYEKELLLQLGLFTPIIVYGAYTLHKKDKKTSKAKDQKTQGSPC